MGATSFEAQRRGWALLNQIRPAPIDLSRVEAIRQCSRAELESEARVVSLIAELGLNDEGLSELPPELHARCGGLRIWQYPIQFAPYLTQLGRLGVRSYLEIGIRHGGSFVATVEYLERFAPLDFAVGVDVIDCPSMAGYQKAQFWRMSSRSAEFAAKLDSLGPIDLVFIDSHHEEEQCRAELALLSSRARMIAFHDIVNVGCPGIQRVWSELAHSPAYRCFEYVEQYPGLGPFTGIGLAVRVEPAR